MSTATEAQKSAPAAPDVVDGQAEGPKFTFPPFPSPPEGVTIIPFKDFKERGIQIFSGDDGEELDGLGIPTIELRVKHNTDSCKTNAKKRKKADTASTGVSAKSGVPIRKEWWEQWEEGEDLRTSGSYNPNLPRIDRLFEAAREFRVGRTWPPGQTGVRALWDQFRLYVGLLANTPIWRRTDKPAEDDADDDSEDEFADGETNVVVEDQPPPARRYPPRPRARPPYANYGEESIPVSNDEEVRELLAEENARKEESMMMFLNDPETTIKIFLSSYMRKEGLIWSDRNLTTMPRLLYFFINFLLRNRVLPESTYERGFRKSLEVVKLAQMELPLTSKIAKLLPDEFHMACQECWGTKADGYKRLSPIPEVNTRPIDEADESDAKRVKLDPGEKFEEELKAANYKVVKTDEDIVMDDASASSATPFDQGAEPLLGGGWGEVKDLEDFKVSTPADTIAVIDDDPWGAPTFNWDPPVRHSLMKFVGVSAIPLTHTTGIVEWSLRRIKSIAPPLANVPKSALSADGGPDADAVESELERWFGKVVLEPWVGWDLMDEPSASKPRILESSRGSVVSEGEAVVENGDALGLKSHDPFKDSITLLVDPSVLDSLSVGLGLGGTWVQLAQLQDVGEGEPAKKKKKKGKGKKKPVERYWYLDELMMTLPSYYTA